MKSFDANGVNNGRGNLASLYDGEFIAERMGRREGHRLINGLCTLAIPFNMPGQDHKVTGGCNKPL